MKTFSHTRPVRDDAGNIVGQKPAPVARATVAALGGQFGRDHARRLVVSLRPGDVIEFRPERTRQAVSALAVDVYRQLLAWDANRKWLERKKQKAEARKRRGVER